MLKLNVQAFHRPKTGNRVEEYEDAWAYDEQAGRLAIADGASDAFESRLWARALVQAFIHQPPAPETMLQWLQSPAQTWEEGIHWEQLPWYAAEKARRGAFATLLGVTFDISAFNSQRRAASIPWQALALGDACLFQIRKGKLLQSLPITQATDFGTTPPLLSTKLDYNRRSFEELQCREGECRPGDLLVLATDALAAWFLQQIEVGQRPWRRLLNLSPGKFARLVERLQTGEAMRNDDVTLLLGWIARSDEAAAPAQAGSSLSRDRSAA